MPICEKCRHPFRCVCEDIKHLLQAVQQLNERHVFLLVEEAEGDVLGSTKDLEEAVEWYLQAVEHQSRWFNPAVYACNKPVDGYLEDENAVPLLTSYHYLTSENLAIVRDAYLSRFPTNLLTRALPYSK